VTVLACILAHPGRALAQTAAPAEEKKSAPSAGITMPVPKKSPGAAYPKQALDEGFYQPTEVSVLITVDVNGNVTNAVVETPVGHGFDEAALEATKAMQFAPATRDGAPVAARTRIRYQFSPLPSAFTGRVLTLAGDRPIAGAIVQVKSPSGVVQQSVTATDGSWRIDGLPGGTYGVDVSATGMLPHKSTAEVKPGEELASIDRLEREPPPAAPDAGAETDVEEVEVHGKKPPREVAKRTLDQREINRVPGTGGDALLSLQNLPGVGRPPPLSGLLLIRGAGPNDTTVYIDGTPIPLVYHFGGLASVVPTEVIDRIDLYPGNFSTQYGRAMGGVVDVALASPKSDRLHALAEVNLLDSRVVVQGPIFDTGWRFTLAGRRSYFDTWLGPVLTAAGANVSVAPVYYDYQAILERDLSKGSTFRLALIGSDDRLALLLTNTSSGAPTLAGQLSTHTGFWMGQASYKSHLNDTTDLRLTLGIGQTYVDFNLGSLAFNLTTWPITGRAEVSTKLDPHLTMNVGLDVWDFPYTLSAYLPPLPNPGQPPPGPFSSQPLRYTRDSATIYEPAAYVEWEATPWKGARIVPGLRLDYTKDTRAWDFDPRIVIRQDITSSPRTTLKAGAGLFSQPPQPQETNAVFGMSGLTSNRAYQYDVGIERQVTRQVDATVDGFYKQLDHLVVQNLGNTGTGVIYGGEAMLRYNPDGRFFGWVSYTLSRSLLRDAPGMPLRLSPYDETHVLTILGSYKLGRGWEFGARFRLTSGYMYTPEQYGFFDENVGTYTPQYAYPPYSSRLPLFQALDFRVDKEWRFRWGAIGAFFELNNAYNAANVAGINYNFNSTKSSYVSDLPILPSLGLRVEM
jgi:TonB family protein